MEETTWDRDIRAIAAAILTNQRGPKNEVPDARSVASYAAVLAAALEAERTADAKARAREAFRNQSVKK